MTFITHFIVGLRSALEHDPRRRRRDRDDGGDRRGDLRGGLQNDQKKHSHALRQRFTSFKINFLLNRPFTRFIVKTTSKFISDFGHNTTLNFLKNIYLKGVTNC